MIADIEDGGTSQEDIDAKNVPSRSLNTSLNADSVEFEHVIGAEGIDCEAIHGRSITEGFL